MECLVDLNIGVKTKCLSIEKIISQETILDIYFDLKTTVFKSQCIKTLFTLLSVVPIRSVLRLVLVIVEDIMGIFERTIPNGDRLITRLFASTNDKWRNKNTFCQRYAILIDQESSKLQRAE